MVCPRTECISSSDQTADLRINHQRLVPPYLAIHSHTAIIYEMNCAQFLDFAMTPTLEQSIQRSGRRRSFDCSQSQMLLTSQELLLQNTMHMSISSIHHPHNEFSLNIIVSRQLCYCSTDELPGSRFRKVILPLLERMTYFDTGSPSVQCFFVSLPASIQHHSRPLLFQAHYKQQ